MLGAPVGLQRAVEAGLNKTRQPQTPPPITAHARNDAGVRRNHPGLWWQGVMDNSAKRSFSIKTFCERNEVGRTTAYAEINAGRLRASKVGRRTIITDKNEAEWLKILPAVEPKS